MTKPEQMNTAAAREPQRLLALSDGLFATVLTLLVLDLRLPDALNGGGITTFVKWIGPHLFSYLLTFFVTAIYWLAHHRDFDHIIGYDRGLLGYNLLFLLFVGLFPFSTAAVGLTGFSSVTYPFYWAVYSVNIILAGIMLTLTWLYAVSHHQVDASTTRLESRRIVARQLVTPVIFLVSIIVEYAFPRLFLGPYALLLIPLVQALVDRGFARAELDQPAVRQGFMEFLWRAGTTLIWLLIIGLALWASNL
jgi:uncharacterized membrane protein